jgi:hypothetical protein
MQTKGKESPFNRHMADDSCADDDAWERAMAMPVETPNTAQAFRSILYADGARPAGPAPACLRDLNLDQLIAALTAGRDEYDLAPFYHHPLTDEGAVAYRQAVLRDLADEALLAVLRRFGADMREMRKRLGQAEKLHDPWQKRFWTLHAAQTYCGAVAALRDGLAGPPLASAGMLGLRAYLARHVAGAGFTALRREVAALGEGLAAIRYAVTIRDGGFRVTGFDGGEDYSAEVALVFAKFRQSAATDYRVKFHEYPEMNHIEAKVLEFVALLNPEVFGRLRDFAAGFPGRVDAVLARFDREIQFYLSYLECIAPLRRAGLPFCQPEVSGRDKAVLAEEFFDLPLARKLVGDQAAVVRNDFRLDGDERIFVVSGPNQGGKTTFARGFGQLHHLAALGLPVPGRRARLFLCDAVFTHFEHEEQAGSRRGKLQDDLMRIHGILARATPRSIFILNEIFNSTTLEDATFLAGRVLARIVALDALCVCVTFLDELVAMSPTIVSMTSMVVPDDPSTRTFRVVRRPADGRAYALSIAEKYRLTRAELLRRIPAREPESPEAGR